MGSFQQNEDKRSSTGKNIQRKGRKMRQIVCVAAALLVVLIGSTVFGQPSRGSGGWGMKGSYQRMYNPATVETVKGEVVAVEKITPMKGMRYGIHLMVKTDKETIPIHLGPAWFIERQDTKIEKGDRIEVTGSRVTVNGKPAIIAAEVKKGGNVLVLRDKAGVPVWSGWRR
jgi:ribosome-associated protein YbcJ (S4-like RNA binding protein)